MYLILVSKALSDSFEYKTYNTYVMGLRSLYLF